MEAIDVIKSRRSIRSYTDEMPARELVDQVVEVCRKAPNAGAVSFTVVRDAALIQEMDDACYQVLINSEGFGKARASLPGYRPFYHAPVCIIFSAKPEEYYGGINCACAATAGAYAATALGLGSCFIGQPSIAFREIPDLGQRLQLPEGFAPVCGLLLGYTDDPELYAVPSDPMPAVEI